MSLGQEAFHFNPAVVDLFAVEQTLMTIDLLSDRIAPHDQTYVKRTRIESFGEKARRSSPDIHVVSSGYRENHGGGTRNPARRREFRVWRRRTAGVGWEQLRHGGLFVKERRI